MDKWERGLRRKEEAHFLKAGQKPGREGEYIA